MKKIAFACFMVLILAFQLTCVSAFNADNVSISIDTNKVVISVVSGEDLGRMTLQLLSGDGASMLYMGQENSYAEKIKNESGGMEYRYVFDSFHFPSDAATGEYIFRVSGSDGKIVSKPYAFVNVLDSFKFLNGLHAAEDVNGFLKENKDISLTDLTSYFKLEQPVYSLVDKELKSLDFSVKEDFSDLSEKTQLFKTQFGNLMLSAEVLASGNGSSWTAAIQAAKAVLELDTAYYDKLSDKQAAYGYFEKPQSLLKEDIGKEFDKAVAVAALKQLDYGSLEALLTFYENRGILTLDRSDFGTLKDEQKLTVCQRLKEDRQITDVKTLQTEFRLISEQVAKEKGSSGGSSSGGSGSGGGSGSKRHDITIGGGSGSGSTPGTSQPQNDMFADLDEVSWAKGYIVSLANRGILSGKGDGMFYPGASMLREEFVKVVAAACKIDISSEHADFSDVADGAWYAPYIAACVNADIVNGTGDGRFGIGATITREDAAVMIVRALEYAGVESASAEENFADEREISSYAQEAVKKLRKLGIISGDDNGNFKPKAAISRAEVSKIIYGMLDIIGG